MSKKPGIDPEYYESHCFAEEMAEAKKRGDLIVTRPGESALESIKRHMAAKKRTAISMRVPVYVLDGVKAQAKRAGVPYTSYICAVLEKSIEKAPVSV